MLTSLDLLVIAFMAITALSLLAALLMFLIRNKTVRRVSLYIVSALALYLAAMGFYIALYGFVGQALIALLAGAAAIGAVVLDIIGAKKGFDRLSLASRICAAAALVIGFINAIS